MLALDPSFQHNHYPLEFMRARQLVLALVPLLNLHTSRVFASQSVLSAMSTMTSTATPEVMKLGNGIEVKNEGIPLEGNRRQIVEDVLNVSWSLGRSRFRVLIGRGYSCSALSRAWVFSIGRGDKMLRSR